MIATDGAVRFVAAQLQLSSSATGSGVVMPASAAAETPESDGWGETEAASAAGDVASENGAASTSVEPSIEEVASTVVASADVPVSGGPASGSSQMVTGENSQTSSWQAHVPTQPATGGGRPVQSALPVHSGGRSHRQYHSSGFNEGRSQTGVPLVQVALSASSQALSVRHVMRLLIPASQAQLQAL